MASPASAFPVTEGGMTEQKSSPLAGPGTTRANRRLQLRKNGFRGRVMANRNITPKRKTSEAWSSPPPQDDTPTSDLPRAASSTSEVSTRGRSSSILQEVSNSSLRRKGQNKAKHDSVLSIFTDENGEQKAWNFESSPACLPLEAPNLTKSRKKHERTQSYKSNPDSDQADQHIAYLESELAAYQTQLASLTSPSVTKEKSQKIRLLNQEIRRLQEENEKWEAEFDERLDHVMLEHNSVENNLRARINLLESDTDNYVQKVKELQAQLDATRKALDIAEAANVEFERRLETFAHLLVTSPIKTETPLAQPPFPKEQRKARQQRLSFHRFPTAGSLHQQATVPEQQEETRPQSEGAIYDHFETASDAEWDISKRESIISDASRNSINFDVLLSQDAPPSSSRTRPNRRMRRFQGGSHNPKPLILSAAQLAPILASAPVMEPHESPRSFPFPEIELGPRRNSCHEFSPLTGRRRAKTTYEGLELSNLQPFSNDISDSSISSLPTEEQNSKTPTPPETIEQSTSGDYSSIGPNIGRNLLEELHAVRVDADTEESSERADNTPFSTFNSRPVEFPGISSSSTGAQRAVSGTLRLRHQRSMSEATGLSMYPSSRQTSTQHLPTQATTSKPSNGIFATLAELCRAPYALARRCVVRAHQAFLLSRTLNRLQWMLLHALLGPMATRRLMACSLHENALLISSPSRSSPLRRKRSRKHLSSSPHSEDAYAADSEGLELSPCPTRPIFRRADTLTTPRPASSTSSCVFEQQQRRQQKRRSNEAPMLSRHSPWLWIRFSLTLAFAVAAAVKEGPGALLAPCEGDGQGGDCACLSCAARGLRDCSD